MADTVILERVRTLVVATVGESGADRETLERMERSGLVRLLREDGTVYAVQVTG